MKLSEFIAQAVHLANGQDPDLELFDRNRGVELRNDPDTDTWDFEVLRGDGCVVIEFD